MGIAAVAVFSGFDFAFLNLAGWTDFLPGNVFRLALHAALYGFAGWRLYHDIEGWRHYSRARRLTVGLAWGTLALVVVL